MNKILIYLILILVIASCKKDKINTNSPDVSKLRVQTATTYNEDGNIITFCRYSYYDDGMIKQKRELDIIDQEGDTSALNRYLIIRNYVREANSIKIFDYYEQASAGHYWYTDTTTILLNSDGLGYQELRKGNPFVYGDNPYWLTNYTYDSYGYMKSFYNIMYLTDSLNPQNILSRVNETRVTENGNCIILEMTGDNGFYKKFYYTYDPSQLYTLNYGESFFGKLNTNAVTSTRCETASDTTEYTSQYVFEEGKIVKIEGASNYTVFTYLELE